MKIEVIMIMCIPYIRRSLVRSIGLNVDKNFSDVVCSLTARLINDRVVEITIKLSGENPEQIMEAQRYLINEFSVSH